MTATTNETIPLQSVATNTVEVVNRCFQNNQAAERNIDKRAAFTYTGTLDTHTWDVSQSCLSNEENFDEAGCADYDFNQHSENIAADCDCHPLSASHRGRIDTNCECEGCECKDNQRDRANRVDDPDRDIENKVSKTVERAIADILSGIVN